MSAISQSTDIKSALRHRQQGFLINPFRFSSGAPSNTYATWNPSDKNANIILSNGNLRAATDSGTNGLVRSTIGKSSGKWYWEYTTESVAGMIGIANASATLAGYPGADSNGRGYFHTGNIYVNSAGTSYGVGYTYDLGKVIGVALDMDAGSIGFYVNGAYQGLAFTPLSGVFFAAAGGVGGPTIYYNMNFGATPFVHPVPAGFNPGLYN